jgi:type I restriction enzyme S subunit
MIREKAAFDGKLTREWREENNSNNFSDLEDYKIGENHHTKSLIAKELPPNWKQVNFEDVLDIISGKNQKYVEDENGMYPIYGSGGVIGKANEYLCEAGTTIVGRKGTINTPIYVNEKFWNIDTAFGLSPSKILYSKYLFYFCQGFNFKTLDKSTTIPSLAKRDLLKIKLQLAPLPEQRAIVAKIEELFSELDSGIASLKKAKDQLEVYRQAVLKAAFEGKLTREWRKENQYTEKYVEEIRHKIYEFNSNKEGQDIPRRLPTISFEKLPSSPFGWEWIEAHKVCQSVRDGTHDTPRYVKEGIPLITSKNLKKGNIDFENINYISLTDHKEISNRSKVEKNDILFGMIGTIGNPVIVKENNLFSIKNVGLFKKNEDLINPRYLYHYLSSWFVEKIMLDQELIRGTTQKFVALGGLRMLPIPLPSLKEQEEIIKEIESRLSVCENIEATIEEALEKAEALGQSILKKAFEGKLLSNEELEACRRESDWEPAEDLLKRIKEDKKGAKSNG